MHLFGVASARTHLQRTVRTAAACALVAAVWIPAAVAIAGRARWLTPAGPAGRAAALLVLVLAVLIPCSLIAGARLPARKILLSGPMAMGSLAAILAIVATEFPPVRIATASTFLLGAWIEELVFRLLLPALFLRAHFTSLSQVARAFGATVAAQLLFAVSHVPIAPAFDVYDLARLFAGGMLYALCLNSVGLGPTAALHAAFNISAMTGEAVGSTPRAAITVALAATAALWMVLGDRSRLKASLQSQPQLGGV